MLVLIIIICILSGMVLGFLLRRKLKLLRLADKAAMYAVYALLFVLGAGLGYNAELFAKLPTLGLTALVITVCTCTGSALGMLLIQRMLADAPPHLTGKPKPPANESLAQLEKQAARPTPAAPSPLKSCLRILACFLTGMLLARFGLLPAFLNNSSLVDYALFLLVFFVGISLGGELKAFLVLRDMHLKVLAVPVLITVGSLAGAAAASFILPEVTVRQSMAVGSGMSYYSLTGLLIGQVSGDAALGSIGLLSNVFRELIAILTAPLLARWLGPLTPIGLAGAAAMDTNLPGIARFCGERYAIIAVFSGVTLTLVVPFLVPLILTW